MLSEQEISSRLKLLGYKDPSIPEVMQSVGLMIAGKALARYMGMLSEEERAHIRKLDEQELEKYIAEKIGSLPPFPQEEFDAIHDQTWQEYFGTAAHTS